MDLSAQSFLLLACKGYGAYDMHGGNRRNSPDSYPHPGDAKSRIRTPAASRIAWVLSAMQVGAGAPLQKRDDPDSASVVVVLWYLG